MPNRSISSFRSCKNRLNFSGDASPDIVPCPAAANVELKTWRAFAWAVAFAVAGDVVGSVDTDFSLVWQYDDDDDAEIDDKVEDDNMI